MNYMFRFVGKAVVAVILVLSVVPRLVRIPTRWMKTARWLCLSALLSTTAFIRTESLWIVLPTAPKRQPTHIFSLSSAKITTPNVAETPETSPVIDRYRVYRKSGKIEWLERIEENWRPYNSEQIR
jgi:hypothetical protein